MGDNEAKVWLKHILEELKRLNSAYEKLNDRVTKDIEELKAADAATSIEIRGFKESQSDQEKRLRAVEKEQNLFAGKWGLLALVGATIVSLIIGFVFKAVTSPANASPPHQIESTDPAGDKPQPLLKAIIREHPIFEFDSEIDSGVDSGTE